METSKIIRLPGYQGECHLIIPDDLFNLIKIYLDEINAINDLQRSIGISERLIQHRRDRATTSTEHRLLPLLNNAIDYNEIFFYAGMNEGYVKPKAVISLIAAGIRLELEDGKQSFIIFENICPSSAVEDLLLQGYTQQNIPTCRVFVLTKTLNFIHQKIGEVKQRLIRKYGYDQLRFRRDVDAEVELLLNDPLKKSIATGAIIVINNKTGQEEEPFNIIGINGTTLRLETQQHQRIEVNINDLCPRLDDDSKDRNLEECRQRLTSWGWAVDVDFNAMSIDIKLGYISGVVAITVEEDALNTWLDLAEFQEIPITLTYTLPSGLIYYLYRYEGTEDLPNYQISPGINFLTQDETLTLPCPSMCYVSEGLDQDLPILAILPRWIHRLFLEVLN